MKGSVENLIIKINKFCIKFCFISIVIAQVNTENFRIEEIDDTLKINWLSFSYEGADTKVMICICT